MSNIEDLKNSLLSEAKAEERKILSQAEKEATAITAKAKETAKKIKDDAKKKASETLSLEKKERLSAAKLKAKRVYSDARNKAVEKMLEKIKKEFEELPKSKSYEKFLKELIKQGEKEIGTCTVSVNAKDAKLAKKASKNVTSKAESIAGGAIITSKDKKVSIDNSFEAIFENKKEELTRIIYLEIFTEKGGMK
ncbi:MAG: hypothetical protein COV47_06005 [Candidatus Diapherotrites archaeon CG11_big_fil_rev_8_21_14_0_20_37_9]|nr:MAG: hypothetical protein COV47_06005 [Candidatus Diapherotrites archaeon CG11_big_fil_rev_8_21_14_0_20_37_9]